MINLLKQALEMLVGSEVGNTVESCSGGLLGEEVFTMRIPVVGVSACDFAGVLQIVVDAVDKLAMNVQAVQTSLTAQEQTLHFKC